MNNYLTKIRNINGIDVIFGKINTHFEKNDYLCRRKSDRIDEETCDSRS